jgi:MraZ protein
VPRFFGRTEHALDDKGRLVVPVRYRERLGNKFIVTVAEPEQCLALYPQSSWEAFCAQLDDVPVKDERYRRFVRHVFSHTEETACDAQGRLLIPASLRAYAGIERDAVSLGFSRRVEIWSKDRLDASAPSPEEVAAFTTANGLI